MSKLLARLGRRPNSGAEVVPRPEGAVGALPSAQAHHDARLAILLEVAERLTRSFDRADVLKTIALEVNAALGADATTIRVLENDQLVVAASAGLTDDEAAALPIFGRDDGWFGAVFQSGRPAVYEDMLENPEYGPMLARYSPRQAFRSDLVAPLIHEGEVMGAMSSVAYRPRAWSGADVEFARALATHASIALHNAALFSRTSAWAGQLGVLQAASARMSRQNTVESVGRAIVEEVRGIIDYHNCRVYQLVEPDDLVPIAFEGAIGAYEKVDFDVLRTKLGHGFSGWAAEHATPLLIHDANADPRGATIPGTDDVDESMLVVPMRYDERVVGVITLSKLGINQFGEDDLRLLMILADQAATALESARLVTRSHELTMELRRLLDMGAELAKSLDPLTVADLIARHVATAMGVDHCAISYWDREADQVLTWGYFPLDRPEEVQAAYALAEYPATRTVLEEQGTVVVQVYDPNADPNEVAFLRREGFSSMAMLPLVAKGQSIGLVELLSSSPVTFGQTQLDLARTMANEAAMALENARLYEDARKLADHDQLTGFYNHRFLHERLGEEIVRAQRSRAPLSLLMIDLDDFKLVNDTFGHLFGDRVLAWVAELIRSTLRGSDVPARYGGDEFAVILPDTDADHAQAAARRILAAFSDRPYLGEGRGPVPMAGSIGVASSPADGRTAQALIAAADAALYRVKDAGGHGAELARKERHLAAAEPMVAEAIVTELIAAHPPGPDDGAASDRTEPPTEEAPAA